MQIERYGNIFSPMTVDTDHPTDFLKEVNKNSITSIMFASVNHSVVGI